MRWSNRTNSPARRGFTLVEAALTTVIVGLGTVAMMGLLTSGTSSNQQAANLTTAVNLANDIHELCDRLPFNNVNLSSNSLYNSNVAVGQYYWGIPTAPAGLTIANLFTAGDGGNITWLNGQTFNASSTPAGPVDATFSAISGMSGWSQAVTVNSVSATSLTAAAATNDESVYNFSRITVTISLNGQRIYQTSWLVAK